MFDLWIHNVTPAQAIDTTLGAKITEDTSDGWHTFKELYHHRALLFSVIVHNYRELCWKSRKHDDGTELDWNFIVGIDTPWGQASYHYGMEYWDMFDCKELERAPHYDGYTPEQAVERIARLVELDAAEASVEAKERKADDGDVKQAITAIAETCSADETDTWECVRDDMGGYGKKLTVHVMECTECGRTYEHVNGGYEHCPRCGKKVVEE